MAEIRVAALLEPARIRTVAVFAAAAGALSERAQRAAAVSYKVASAIAFFVTPVAVVALAFGLWRLAADLGWAGNFPIASGLFSHWMVWIALAAGLKSSVALLNRPAGADQPETGSNDLSGPQ